MRYLGRMKNHVITGVFIFAAALFMFVANVMEVQAYIQTEGTVVSDSAVIRKEPNANSNAIASIMKGDQVTINNEEADSNGVIWYKVFVDANTLGYVRGDLIQKEGSAGPITNTPTTSTDTSSNTTGSEATSNTNTPQVDANVTIGATTAVTPVQSQGASVTGDTVRVRAEASTNSAIVTQVRKSTAITVNGQADGQDGKVWYKVSFIVDGKEMSGFIRSDFVQLTEEIVVIDENITEEQPENTEIQEELPVQEETVNTDYVLKYEANEEGISEWYLYNNVEGVKNKLSEILDAAEGNGEAVDLAEAQLKKQKTIIIIMAIVLIFLALAVTLLFFKLRDMYYDDFDSYDDEPEIPKRSNNTTPRTVKPVQGERPAARPNANAGVARQTSGQNRQQNGKRPVQGQGHPAGSQNRSQNGQRPMQGQGRPANGQNRSQNGQRPVQGQSRPANMQNRPANTQNRPQNTVPNPNSNPAAGKNDAGWKAKNFMTDDDLEFEFLNWDGEEK